MHYSAASRSCEVRFPERSNMTSNFLPSGLSQDEGDAFWFLNNLATIKATSASTGGSFALIHQLAPPGAATPYHLHHEEDEAFYMLDGQASFICNGEKVVLTTGGYI